MQNNQGKHGGYPALRTGSTIATWMHGQGYQTGFIGKHLNRYQEFDRRDPGWDYFKPLTDNVYGYQGFAFHGERGQRGYVTDAIADRTRQAITRFSRSRKPFLLMVNHVAPHARVTAERDTPPVPAATYRNAHAGARSPSFADPAFNERDLRDKVGPARHRHRVPKSKVRTWFLARIRSLASVDDAVASAVRTLRARGELDDTYVAFTSDNGMALGEHRYFGKNQLTDEILRVPLLMRGPGIDAGAVDERIVTLVDLTATFLDLAGVKPRLKIDGRSIAAPGSRDTTLVQTGRTMLRRDFANGWAARGVVTDRYLYSIDPRHRANDVLYDRLRDPHELRNVADRAAYAGIRRELRSRTDVLGRCAGARCNRTFRGAARATRLSPWAPGPPGAPGAPSTS